VGKGTDKAASGKPSVHQNQPSSRHIFAFLSVNISTFDYAQNI